MELVYETLDFIIHLTRLSAREELLTNIICHAYFVLFVTSPQS